MSGKSLCWRTSITLLAQNTFLLWNSKYTSYWPEKLNSLFTGHGTLLQHMGYTSSTYTTKIFSTGFFSRTQHAISEPSLFSGDLYGLCFSSCPVMDELDVILWIFFCVPLWGKCKFFIFSLKMSSSSSRIEAGVPPKKPRRMIIFGALDVSLRTQKNFGGLSCSLRKIKYQCYILSNV